MTSHPMLQHTPGISGIAQIDSNTSARLSSGPSRPQPKGGFQPWRLVCSRQPGETGDSRCSPTPTHGPGIRVRAFTLPDCKGSPPAAAIAPEINAVSPRWLRERQCYCNRCSASGSLQQTQRKGHGVEAERRAWLALSGARRRPASKVYGGIVGSGRGAFEKAACVESRRVHGQLRPLSAQRHLLRRSFSHEAAALEKARTTDATPRQKVETLAARHQIAVYACADWRHSVRSPPERPFHLALPALLARRPIFR